MLYQFIVKVRHGTTGAYTETRERWGIAYLVPDSRIWPDFPKLDVRSFRVRKFPIFGKVIGMRWRGPRTGLVADTLESVIPVQEFHIFREFAGTVFEGRDINVEVVRRLNQYNAVMETLGGSGRPFFTFFIFVDHLRGCWVLSDDRAWDRRTEHRTDINAEICGRLMPTGEQWDAYQAIGKTLLAMPMPIYE